MLADLGDKENSFLALEQKLLPNVFIFRLEKCFKPTQM